jgi:hypothetical protein
VAPAEPGKEVNYKLQYRIPGLKPEGEQGNPEAPSPRLSVSREACKLSGQGEFPFELSDENPTLACSFSVERRTCMEVVILPAPGIHFDSEPAQVLLRNSDARSLENGRFLCGEVHLDAGFGSGNYQIAVERSASQFSKLTRLRFRYQIYSPIPGIPCRRGATLGDDCLKKVQGAKK